MAKLPPKEKSKTDRIRAVHPRYADMSETYARLVARHEEVIEEIKPLSEQQRRSIPSWQVQAPKPKPQPKRLHEGALALVGSLLSPQPEEQLSPPPPRGSFPGEERLRALGQESEALEEAKKLLQPELSTTKKEYSKLVAARRGAEYTAIVERIVDAARALGDELLAHAEFINQQRLDGVAWAYFKPIDTINHFGDLGDDSSPLRKLVLAAVEQRHVSAGKIPNWKMPVDPIYLQEGN